MKKSTFYWAFNNQELTPDPAMTRSRAASWLRYLKAHGRLIRLGEHTYKTFCNGVSATMRTR